MGWDGVLSLPCSISLARSRSTCRRRGCRSWCRISRDRHRKSCRRRLRRLRCCCPRAGTSHRLCSSSPAGSSRPCRWSSRQRRRACSCVVKLVWGCVWYGDDNVGGLPVETRCFARVARASASAGLADLSGVSVIHIIRPFHLETWVNSDGRDWYYLQRSIPTQACNTPRHRSIVRALACPSGSATLPRQRYSSKKITYGAQHTPPIGMHPRPPHEVSHGLQFNWRSSRAAGLGDAFGIMS
jgi:hypothetical protein